MGSLIRTRSKRILIFVGSRAALEKYDLAGFPILTRSLASQMEKTLYDFSVADEATLVADGRFVEGWRVPPDTFIVFDESWAYPSDHPRTINAKGRVQRMLPPINTDAASKMMKTLGFTAEEIQQIDARAQANIAGMAQDDEV